MTKFPLVLEIPCRLVARPATRAWLVVLFCLVSSTSLLAQSTGGRILGRVADPSGAVLAGVKVTLVNEATGADRSVTTTTAATTCLSKCRRQPIAWSSSRRGSRRICRKDVTSEINQVVTLNMTMQLGEAQEVVEVTSEAPLVETTSTQLGAVVNERAVSQLPLNARDTYQLLSLQPGVQSQTGTDLFYGSDQRRRGFGQWRPRTRPTTSA